MGQGRIPPWDRKIALIQGLQPGGLGRDQGKVENTDIRKVWVPENVTALPELQVQR